MKSLEVKVPSPGEGVKEVTIAKWLVQDGSPVSAGQAIAEIDSDKSTFELEAEMSGIIRIVSDEHSVVVVGDVICTIDDDPSRYVRAPFTTEQVKGLNEYQNSGLMHEFTCGRDGCDRGKEVGYGVLIAKEEGWVCPCGRYTQDWAHEFMTRPQDIRKRMDRVQEDETQENKARVSYLIIWMDGHKEGSLTETPVDVMLAENSTADEKYEAVVNALEAIVGRNDSIRIMSMNRF